VTERSVYWPDIEKSPAEATDAAVAGGIQSRARRRNCRHSNSAPTGPEAPAKGLPLIGPVPGVAGAYIATGHSVWGILNAPATGEAMAELIVDGAAQTVDLAPFNPGRMPRLDPARLRMRS
jgi:FAD dependent oxidoreductase